MPNTFSIFMSPDIILKMIKEVDGAGSGLDSDLFDNHDNSYFAKSSLEYAVSGQDLNLIIESGMYRLPDVMVNAPPGVANGQLLVLCSGVKTIAQVVFPYNSANIYARVGNPPNLGGSGDWTPWFLLWNQDNDGSGSGLDSDTVDGEHASAFAQASHTHTGDDIISAVANAVRAGTVNFTPLDVPVHNASASGNWEDWDISTYVGGNIPVCLIISNHTTTNYYAGIRLKGSTIVKKFLVTSYGCLTLLTRTDTTGIIEIFAENAEDLDFTLYGKFE